MDTQAAPLTPDSLLANIHAALPTMRDTACRLWSREELLKYGGEMFAENLKDNLDACRRGRSNAPRQLAEAVALRIAILLREGQPEVRFLGHAFTAAS